MAASAFQHHLGWPHTVVVQCRGLRQRDAESIQSNARSWYDLIDHGAHVGQRSSVFFLGYRNWSDYLRLPAVKRSLFDFEVGSKPLEVTVE